MVTPIDEDYLVVGEEGRPAGEGSPRHSGEEADPFLQRSQNGASAAQRGDAEVGARTDPSQGAVALSGSLSSNGSSSTNNSGYGVLIDRPTLNLLPSTTEELDRLRRGHILSPEELRRVNAETVVPSSAKDQGHDRNAPLPPPPRLVDPEDSQTTPLHLPFKPKTSHLSQMSTIPDADEPVTVATARRVRVEDLSSRSPKQFPVSLADPGSSRNSGFFAGLSAGLANIGRLSWLKSSEPNSRRTSRARSYPVMPHEDIEAGKSLLQPQMSEGSFSRGRSLGKNSDRTRPLSASTISGGSIYHDARSSLAGTPVDILGTPKLSPLPRALTPSGPAAPERAWPSKSTMSTSQPPSYDLLQTPTTNDSLFNHALPSGQDILDMPAPSAVLPLTSAAASTSTLSLREKNTTSSLVLTAHSFPPGLEVGVEKKSWTEGATQVYTPFAVVSNHDRRISISIDVLEEAPPAAEEGWRSMAAVIQDGPGRRTTFGGYAPFADIVSEQGSLYSNHSQLGVRTSSSTPASRRDQSYSTGSASSRPSALSAVPTIDSGHSIAAPGSVSSAEQKRSQAVSPALSAFGPTPEEPSPSPPSPSPTAHFNDGTVRSTDSASTAVDTLVDTLSSEGLVTTTATEPPSSPTSTLIQISNAPWATGLDQDWNPT